MDLENEKIGPAFSAPDSYFKDTESRLLQRLGIQKELLENQAAETVETPITIAAAVTPLDTLGVQKRARKQDPITAKSQGINKEVEAVGSVVIPPLTFTTNENPEWVNFGAISEEVSGNGDQIKVVSYGDLLSNTESNDAEAPSLNQENITPEIAEETVLEAVNLDQPITTVETPATELTQIETPASELELPAEIPAEVSTIEPSVIVHEVPESVGLDELESYISANVQPTSTSLEPLVSNEVEETTFVNPAKQVESPSPRIAEEKPISLEAPATAFAPIAGRQHESATPGWLGVAAALAAIVAAYFIWTAIQPPKVDTEQVALQQEEATVPEAPLDEQTPTDTIPDGLQLVEPLIMEEIPKYKEPNVYTITDAEEMPARTKRALQDLEDNGLATFDMEDELFEELDFESL
ncbi:MAG: hypothetical protein FJX91_06225 [Bacteroidetes bacterium]|nr:hypothetical protein [Bacteroidota bacterium]